MRNRRQVLVGGILLIAAAIGASIASCSSPPDSERVGQSASGLGPADGGGPLGPLGPGTFLDAQANYQVTEGSVISGNPGYHEVTLAPVMHTTANGQTPNWVMGFNANPVSWVGWAYSAGIAGQVWTINVQDGGAFGSPCSGNCMSDGNPFGGMGGDPSMATVTNPTNNGSSPSGTTGLQAVYTNGANSTATSFVDWMVAISNDGGHTFGHPHLLTSTSTGGGSTGGNGNVDNATVASHFASPYSIFAAWNTPGNGKGYITQIQYGPAPGFSWGGLTGSPQNTIPLSNPLGSTANNIYHPAVAIGQLNNCSTGNPDEIVYIAWADNVGGAGCPPAGTGWSAKSVGWWLAAFDATNPTGGPSNSGWYGPWQIDSDPAWPGCVGGDGGVPPNNADRAQYDNDVRPRIATEPSNTLLWMAYNKHSDYGTRIVVSQVGLVCCTSGSCNGTFVPGSGGPAPVSPPVKCWCPQSVCPNGCNSGPGDGGPPYNNPTGTGYTVNDQWGPTLAFVRNSTSGNRELAATWYDTREDQYNILTNIYGFSDIENTININNLPGQTIRVGANSGTPAGQNVPWNHTLQSNFIGGWWDYQALASEPITFTFLGAWGGDNRLCDASTGCGVPGRDGIWSAILK